MENGKFKTYTTENGLSHGYIHSLFEDKKENIWIGTGNGVNRINKNGEIRNFSNSKGFCNKYIGTITEDNYGNIWFGTDRCIVKFDGLDFKPITVDDGLSSGVIYLLHKDRNGNIWVGTNNGLDKISLNSYGQIVNIKNYKAKQGFKGVECNSRAVYEDDKGNLWIGTVKGLVKYNPKEDRSNVFEPTLHINNIKLYLEDVDWLKYSKELTKWDNLPVNLTLEHNQNHITFEFSAINLTSPENIHYKYKLKPFDQNWYEVSDKNFVTYSNLPSGDYTFCVKAKNNDDVWNQNPTEYHFTITSPFWKTWWFYFVIAGILFYLIYKLSSYRERQQLKISKELEEKVKERTHLIETQIEEKEVLLKEIHHRVKNNLQVINSLLSIQSGYTKDEKALELFDEAKNRIRSMALIHEKMYQTGDLATIDFQDYIVALTEDLIQTYSINCDIFLDIKIEKVKFDIDTLIPIGLLLNEIISNALKYAFNNTNKGSITIHLNFNNETNEYTLLVGDNGSGISEELFLSEDSTLGMELIKIFVSQLDGEIELLKQPGSIYKIKFPPRNS
jgi:two-component sensor histidine kinase